MPSIEPRSAGTEIILDGNIWVSRDGNIRRETIKPTGETLEWMLKTDKSKETSTEHYEGRNRAVALESNDSKTKIEFDAIADDYYRQHAANIKVTGEDPEYFHRYKVADSCEYLKHRGRGVNSILDFGSGIGNSVPYFREYFPKTKLYCADVSWRSIELSRQRYPGEEVYLQIESSIPVTDQTFDAVYTACVFHHIPHDEHIRWMRELLWVTKVGGNIILFEHNPINPLTVRAVNTCPFDVNAKLIRAGVLRRTILSAGWRDATIEYKVFFPRALAPFRPFEKYLRKACFGAQYRIVAKK